MVHRYKISGPKVTSAFLIAGRALTLALTADNFESETWTFWNYAAWGTTPQLSHRAIHD